MSWTSCLAFLFLGGEPVRPFQGQWQLASSPSWLAFSASAGIWAMILSASRRCGVSPLCGSLRPRAATCPAQLAEYQRRAGPDVRDRHTWRLRAAVHRHRSTQCRYARENCSDRGAPGDHQRCHAGPQFGEREARIGYRHGIGAYRLRLQHSPGPRSAPPECVWRLPPKPLHCPWRWTPRWPAALQYESQPQ